MCGVVDIIKHFFSNTLASIEKPKVRVVDVDLKGEKDGVYTYLVKLNFSNPYCIPIPLSEIHYVLKSSGSMIANGTIPDIGSLKAKGDTILYAEINLPHGALVTLVQDITDDWDIDYELDATLVIDIICDINIPISSNGEIKLPTIVDLFPN
ncbi:unnamed protein product [Lactuca saligna]|uniref:Water stress and hypersensitive response domain-containing protein n=1 Tax=Lactuca saligna TaxID=75948 RepID=A0AA35ZGH2_LACSI|nr:unnamed protein product [Lactuca saligna]